jgi:hypothetical protein
VFLAELSRVTIRVSPHAIIQHGEKAFEAVTEGVTLIFSTSSRHIDIEFRRDVDRDT